jgi:predicted small lipoprotein YifL
MKGQILFKRLVLGAVVVTVTVACGQKGALYLPTDPAALDRASLPEVLIPRLPSPTPEPSTRQP